MTSDDLAALHAVAFAPERGWSAAEFDALLASPYVTLFACLHGFALVRVVAGEAELLTLAVDPTHHRQGGADRIMHDWMGSISADSAFLEVAEDNTAALKLYTKHGFAVSGRRRGYYARPNGPAIDALMMKVALTRR